MVETQFKNTDIGKVPEDWGIKTLGEFCFITKLAGFEYSKHFNSYKDGGEIIVLRGINITKNKLNLSDCKYIPKKISDYLERSKLFKGDLVFAYVGTIGPTYLIQEDNRFHLGPNTAKIRLEDNSISSKYLFNYFLSNNFKKEIDLKISVGAQPSLSMGKIRSFKIPLPPLPEQNAIAEVLSDTDAWIESLEKLITKKRLVKQGAMQRLLTPKEDWEVRKLGEITEISKGKNLSKKLLDFNGKFNCILYGELFTTYKEVIKNVICRTNYEDSVRSLNGDILFPGSTTTTGIDLAKASTILKNDVLLGGDIIIVRKKNYEYNSIFLTYFLNVIKKFEIAQNTRGITIHHLYGSDLKDIEASFPNLDEQTRIVTMLSDMDAEIEYLEKKLNKAKQLKQGIMQQLLTGKIRLTEVKQEETKPVKKHNDHFNDAVLIGALASCYASEQYPMTRFKYTKVSYLFKRYKEEQTTGYLKKAAGPYKPETRYGGAEKIAITNKYVTTKKSVYKGKQYEGFVNSTNIQEAVEYFKKWYGEDALQWVSRFKFETNDNLELWATVDMAMQDLKNENKPINLGTIKEVINKNKEWKDKLKRTVFSDDNIKNAIMRLETLYT